MSDAPAPKKRKWKDTLHLPKTEFAMRAGLAANEPNSVARWAEINLAEQLREARSASEPFVFHDGPPFANGNLHLGHLLNKVLKDFVVRSRLMQGHQVTFVPGWDCHGLPIEHKVMTNLVEAGRGEALAAMGEGERRLLVRNECQAFAKKFVEIQSGQMARLLTHAEYDAPYLTMDPSYEKVVLEGFADLVDQGLVTRRRKPVHWSIANETALAEAELEYQDREDLSVYVDFVACDADAVAAAFQCELEQKPSFTIWTTTPWTLPANLAIAVHERFRYALCQMDGNLAILASDLAAKVAEKAGVSCEILAECDGSALVGLTYEHPFCDRQGRVVTADYVTLEDGTGLVHTAPGHGAEDYQTGLREGLDAYCPVLGDGTYDDTVPQWLVGMSIWDANEKVTEHLREQGHLLLAERFMHSYPHDWRSKTPVIFRATEQWFVGVDEPTKRDEKSLRQLALDSIDGIQFFPEWGRNRFRGMLESRPDWCLSRQRAWGLPIPAFRDANGAVLMTGASVRAVSAVFGEKGSDAWFACTPEELLSGWDLSSDPEAPADLDVGTLEKTYDIFDVWMESGSSWNAVMRARGIGYPIDLYLEGSDQHRGWFQLSLLPALGVTGVAPYKAILTHGFMVDKDGRKMSKSGGNALDVDELLQNYGADVCRWWVASLPFENDIKVDLSFFDVAGESYRKIRNTIRFLIGNLHGMTSEEALAAGDPPSTSIDAWLLGETAILRERVEAAWSEYAFRRAHQLLYDFCNDTVSAVHAVAVKDRLYCDAADSPRRQCTRSTMRRVVDVLLRLLAPMLPHTTDEAWRALEGEDACLAMETMPSPFSVEVHPEWPKVMALRNDVLSALEQAKERGVENAMDAGVILPDPDGLLAPFADELADLFGVSRCALSAEGSIEIQDLREEPRCDRSRKRDGTVREREEGVFLSDRDASAVGL